MTRRALAAALSLSALAAACYTQAMRVESAVYDERDLHWESAYAQWREIVAREDPGDDVAQRAVHHYGLGRAAGVTCRFDESERELLLALDLDTQSHGTLHMTLVELSHLNLDQNKYQAALPYFERALPEMDKVEMSPADHCDFLDDYALALEKTGQLQKAEEVRARALGIRQKQATRVRRGHRTPYGAFCPPGQAQR